MTVIDLLDKHFLECLVTVCVIALFFSVALGRGDK